MSTFPVSPVCVCQSRQVATHTPLFCVFFFFFFFLIKWKADICAVFILSLGSECTAHVTWSNTVKGSHFLSSWFLSSGFHDPQSWPPYYYCVPASLCWRFILFFPLLLCLVKEEEEILKLTSFKNSVSDKCHITNTQKTHQKWFLFRKKLRFPFYFRIEIETTILYKLYTFLFLFF
jgi:hypothetical protein